MVQEFGEIIDVDVLVIGAGGAGLMAVLEATEQPVNVLLVNKGFAGKSGCTAVLEGGYDAAFGFVVEDNPKFHYKDTVEGGGYLNNQILVHILTEESPKKLLKLERYGVLFERDKHGKIVQRSYGGHTRHRVVPHGDWCGREVLSTLIDETTKRGVQIFNEVIITSLLTCKGTICGAIGLDYRKGNILVFKAKSIVLASGGAGWIYGITTNPMDKTGDGFALAYMVGAELIDMEFVQFYPTGFVFPQGLKGVLSREPGRFAEYGAVLLNVEGEKFMTKYDPNAEKATRAVVTRAIFTEIMEGRGTKHGGVYHDFTRVPFEIMKSEMEMWYELCLLSGIDPKRDPIEVAPTCHHFMGGVRINERCESNIPGLYACGEVAGGVHGANRLGGNAFPDIIVFGARAGENAASYAHKRGDVSLSHEQIQKGCKAILEILDRRSGTSPIKLKKKLQTIMWNNVGVYRSRESLNKALKQIQTLKQIYLPKLALTSQTTRYNYEWVEAIEIKNMLNVSEIITRAALRRTETRQSHWRADYPKTDNRKWLKNIVVKQTHGEMKLQTAPCIFLDLRPS